MKRTLLAAILAVAAIAFSCQKKEPATSSSVVMNPTATVENFVLDGASTKTTFSLNNNVASFAFAASDVLRAYPVSPEQGDGLRFTVKQSKGTSCVFTGEGFGLMEGQEYAAYYPGGDDAVPEVFEVPVVFTGQSQPAADEWNLSGVDFLYATGIEPVNGACSFSMKHLGALLIMKVTFTEAGTYKELSLKSSESFITEGVVDLTADVIALEPEGTSDTITLALGGQNGMAVTAGQTVTFYMMVAPVDMSNASLTLTLTDVNDNVIVKEGNGANFQAGHAVQIAGTPEAPAAEAVNLSAEETANSYIVSEAGEYYFDATVGGNGQTVNFAAKNFVNANCWPFVNSAYTSSLPAGGNVRVVLNQNNCVEDVYYADGFIHFTATGAKGNAQLLLMDAANDDPAWVWHIWCTDAPSIITLTDASSWGFTYQIMDRNLGAIRATFDDPTNSNNSLDEVCGLYYQYGNPTGFTWDEFSAASVNNKGWRMVDGIAGAAKYGKPYLDVASDYYWFNPYSGSANQLYGLLWGGGSAGDSSLNRGPAATKTMYDPCPVGYKVVPIDFSISASDSGDQYGWYKNGSDGSVYFPYNGCAWEGGNFWMGRGYVPDGDTAHYTALWTSGHNNRNMAYCYNCYSKDVNRAGGGTVTDHIVARGMGVRCVAE